jgi:tripartite-type tricarboxylate transporter receptor subunit TctC
MAVARMNTALNEALNDPAIQSSMRNLGVEPAPSRPEDFGAYIALEEAKWAKVIRQGNIKIE